MFGTKFDFGFTLEEHWVLYELAMSLVKCYMVKGVIKNAKTNKGYRAAVFKMAEQNMGIYNPRDQSQTIYYDSDGDYLKIALLFEGERSALAFHTSLSQWHLNNPLVVQPGAVSLEDSLLKTYYVEESKLKRVRLTDYVAADSESPVESLEAFHGVPSSCSNISAVSQGDPLALFQSIEKPELFVNCKPYKMNIKSQTKYPMLANDSNNILAGSWTPLHQFFDGLWTVEEIPLVAIAPSAENTLVEVCVRIPAEKRYRVDLDIEFRNEGSALEMASRFKDGSKQMSAITWCSFVHVTEPKLFCKYLKFKYERNKKLWQKIDEE